jgi:hypothetical protein
MRGLDLTSPNMMAADMTRAQVEAPLKAAPGGHGPDFADKRLQRANATRRAGVGLQPPRYLAPLGGMRGGASGAKLIV